MPVCSRIANSTGASPPAKIGVIVESAPHDRKRLSPNIAKASDPARNAKKPISGEMPSEACGSHLFRDGDGAASVGLQ